MAAAALVAGAPAAAQSAHPMQTVIHPGDQISVQVFGDQTLSQNVTVLSDGSIEYPLIGALHVAGKTPQQAASLLRERLLQFVRQPVVNVAITQLAQPSILVLGDVKNPGKYQLRSDGRLSDAIAAAGGIADQDGPYPPARISDPSGHITQVSLNDLLRKGQVNLDRPLGEGDVVYVPGPVQFNVAVSGAVDHPGEIQVNEGDRLAVAIAKAGNSANANADLNHIRLIRNLPDGKQQSIEINLYKALKDNDPSADVALQKGDVIYVPQGAKPGNAGFFASPLLYILSRLIP